MNSEVEIVREINKDYDVIKYLDLEVIRMKCNNFINASKLCAEINKKVNKKKEFRFWLYNKQTIELFDKILKTKNNQIIKPNEKFLTSEIPDVRILTSGKYSEIMIRIKSSDNKLTEIKRLSDTFIKIYKKTTAKFLTTIENNDERNIFKKCGC